MATDHWDSFNKQKTPSGHQEKDQVDGCWHNIIRKVLHRAERAGDRQENDGGQATRDNVVHYGPMLGAIIVSCEELHCTLTQSSSTPVLPKLTAYLPSSGCPVDNQTTQTKKKRKNDLFW